jgi:hypothetical protein
VDGNLVGKDTCFFFVFDHLEMHCRGKR